MTKEMSMSDGASQPAASEQYRCWTYHPKTYREPTHKEWLREVDSLKEELANARRTGQYWKDEHLVGNAEIERLTHENMDLRGLVLAATCPMPGCDGNGYPVHGTDGEPELQQCEWCWRRRGFTAEPPGEYK